MVALIVRLVSLKIYNKHIQQFLAHINPNIYHPLAFIMIDEMSMNNTNKVPYNNETNTTHNVNLSFEIGTSHIYPNDKNEAVLADVKDGKNARTQNDINDTVHEDVKDGAEARALNDEVNGSSNNISHGQNHEMRSGYSGNRMSNIGDPNGILHDNERISEIREKISSDTTLGEESIG